MGSGRIAVLFALLFACLPSTALAYPWMIEHQYTTCSQCHVDPSGGSAMTPYGRSQTEVILRTPYGRDEAEDPGKIKDFLFGVVALPEEVIAQADVRGLFIPRPDDFRFILMQADLRAGVHTESFTAYASAGVVSEGAFAARVIRNGAGDAVTPVVRDYWVGLRPSRSLTVRAGRMNLPFGIRSDQHILYTRAVTRTTTNADQQLGVAAAYEARKWRGELMGIAGNLQVAPDTFRERGYSGMFAYAVSNRFELGASSLVVGSGADVESLLPTTRQAHGVFSRAAPIEGFAVLGEANVLLTSADTSADSGAPSRQTQTGGVLDLHVDLEAIRGLHLKAGGEFCDRSFSEAGSASRGWGAVQWFFAPHVNLRIDALFGPLACTAVDEARPMALAQLHAFL